jgi:peptidoglycan hydrolase CwlO-like protein
MQRMRQTGFMAYDYRVAEVDGQDEQPSPRGPGRPRKWANDAERVRAYRARKAAEQASVDELRRDRRRLRREVTALATNLDRAERAATDAEQQAATLAAEVGQLNAKLKAMTAELARLRLEMAASREAPSTEIGRWAAMRRAEGAQSPAKAPAPPEEPEAPVASLSRAQRRALVRRERRR